MANQKVVKGVRKSVGYVGGIASKEITCGINGWHPHTHDIEFCEHEMSLADFAALSSVYYEYLNKFYSRNGFNGLSRSHGVRVEHVELDATALARYVAKLQEGAAIRLYTAHELTRVDLKKGREGSLMPFDIACSFFETGDMALLDLWHEYERETIGKSVIRFTKGLRARVPGLEGKVLTALDTGDFAALVELLTVYHLDVAGGYWQLEDEVKEGAD